MAVKQIWLQLKCLKVNINEKHYYITKYCNHRQYEWDSISQKVICKMLYNFITMIILDSESKSESMWNMQFNWPVCFPKAWLAIYSCKFHWIVMVMTVLGTTVAFGKCIPAWRTLGLHQPMTDGGVQITCLTTFII